MTTYAEIRITHIVEGWYTDPAAPTLTPRRAAATAPAGLHRALRKPRAVRAHDTRLGILEIARVTWVG
jgi:hypothetical protein